MTEQDRKSAEVRAALDRLGGGGFGAEAAGGGGDVLGYQEGMYKHDNPHKTLNTANFGNKMKGFAFDPRTGSALEAFDHAMGQSPESRAATGLGYAQIAAADRRHADKMAIEREKLSKTSKMNEVTKLLYTTKNQGRQRKTRENSLERR
jgi:hypothetical protein